MLMTIDSSYLDCLEERWQIGFEGFFFFWDFHLILRKESNWDAIELFTPNTNFS